MTFRTIAALGLVLSASLATSLAAQRAAPTTAAITSADLRHRLFLIADDSMKGRDTGTRENAMTADYVAAEFKRLGLKPAGENGGFFQTVPFFAPAPASSTLDLGGGVTLRAGVDFVTIGRPTNAPDSPEFTAVYGGIASDTTTWLSASDADGKLVVFGLRPNADGSPPIFQLAAVFNNPRVARAQGVAVVALGVIDRAQIFGATRTRTALDTTRAASRAYQMFLTPRAAQLMFDGPLTNLTAGTVSRHRGLGNPAMRFAPLPYPARNVIAVLPGRDLALAGTYMSITGHSDHVGVCGTPVDHDSLRAFNRVYRPMGADTRTWTRSAEGDARARQLLDSLRRVRPARADSICNGADDDGTGTVAILELAEYFASLPAAQRPRRSILFVSHVAEEIGLVGSAWYTDHPTVPIDSIVAEIDEDMIGRGRADDLPDGGPTYLEVIGARRLSNEFGDLLESANAAQRVPFAFNYKFDQPGDPLRYYCRADHYNYARYGIPSVALSRGEHLDYHQVTDEPQYIDYDDMARVVTMVRDAITRIANLDHRPKLDKPKGDPRARCVQ